MTSTCEWRFGGQQHVQDEVEQHVADQNKSQHVAHLEDLDKVNGVGLDTKFAVAHCKIQVGKQACSKGFFFFFQEWKKRK